MRGVVLWWTGWRQSKADILCTGVWGGRGIGEESAFGEAGAPNGGVDGIGGANRGLGAHIRRDIHRIIPTDISEK